MENIKARIKSRLEELDLKPGTASRKAGLGYNYLRDLLRSKKGDVSTSAAQSLAAVLKCSPMWLLYGDGAKVFIADGPVNQNGVGASYGGLAEAGVFRPAEMLDQEGEHRRVTISPDTRFAASEQAVWRIEGDSMIEAGILKGMHVLAVNLGAYERVFGEPRDGMLVMVSRHHASGDLSRETTVKRLRIHRDRIELRPESGNAAHEPIILPRQGAEGQPVTAEIIAVVLQSIKLHV